MCFCGTHDTLDGQAIAAWYADKTGLDRVCEPYAALGWINGNGEFICAALFDDFNGANIEMHVVGKATRQIIRTAFRYAFEAARCCRLTVKPKRSNKRGREQAVKIGFVPEGVLKRYYGLRRSDDAIVYRLDRYKAERWMK